MIEIMEMMERDISEVVAMEKEIFSMPWSRQGFLDTLAMDNVCFLVAKESGKLVGYCGLYMAADEGEITNVAVGSTCRRTGIGSTLIDALLAAGRKNSISRFFLEVRVSNESAVWLYEKHGFTRCGIRRGFYEKPKEDAYVMCREYECS